MNPDLHYAGFGRRFGATWLDVLFLAPVAISIVALNSLDRLVPFFAVGASLGVGVFYHVYLVRRFGGTPGKILLGLRIAKVDGSPIGYREATLRYLPEGTFSTLLAIGLAMAALKMIDADYVGLSWVTRTLRLPELAPVWYRPVEILEQVWVWSEFIVLLTNYKRRALHDFIAGTVVVLRTPAPAVAVLASDSAVA